VADISSALNGLVSGFTGFVEVGKSVQLHYGKLMEQRRTDAVKQLLEGVSPVDPGFMYTSESDDYDEIFIHPYNRTTVSAELLAKLEKRRGELSINSRMPLIGLLFALKVILGDRYTSNPFIQRIAALELFTRTSAEEIPLEYRADAVKRPIDRKAIFVTDVPFGFMEGYDGEIRPVGKLLTSAMSLYLGLEFAWMWDSHVNVRAELLEFGSRMMVDRNKYAIQWKKGSLPFINCLFAETEGGTLFDWLDNHNGDYYTEVPVTWNDKGYADLMYEKRREGEDILSEFPICLKMLKDLVTADVDDYNLERAVWAISLAYKIGFGRSDQYATSVAAAKSAFETWKPSPPDEPPINDQLRSIMREYTEKMFDYGIPGLRELKAQLVKMSTTKGSGEGSVSLFFVIRKGTVKLYSKLSPHDQKIYDAQRRKRLKPGDAGDVYIIEERTTARNALMSLYPGDMLKPEKYITFGKTIETAGTVGSRSVPGIKPTRNVFPQATGQNLLEDILKIYETQRKQPQYNVFKTYGTWPDILRMLVCTGKKLMFALGTDLSAFDQLVNEYIIDALFEGMEPTLKAHNAPEIIMIRKGQKRGYEKDGKVHFFDRDWSLYDLLKIAYRDSWKDRIWKVNGKILEFESDGVLHNKITQMESGRLITNAVDSAIVLAMVRTFLNALRSGTIGALQYIEKAKAAGFDPEDYEHLEAYGLDWAPARMSVLTNLVMGDDSMIYFSTTEMLSADELKSMMQLVTLIAKLSGMDLNLWKTLSRSMVCEYLKRFVGCGRYWPLMGIQLMSTEKSTLSDDPLMVHTAFRQLCGELVLRGADEVFVKKFSMVYFFCMSNYKVLASKSLRVRIHPAVYYTPVRYGGIGWGTGMFVSNPELTSYFFPVELRAEVNNAIAYLKALKSKDLDFVKAASKSPDLKGGRDLLSEQFRKDRLDSAIAAERLVDIATGKERSLGPLAYGNSVNRKMETLIKPSFQRVSYFSRTRYPDYEEIPPATEDYIERDFGWLKLMNIHFTTPDHAVMTKSPIVTGKWTSDILRVMGTAALGVKFRNSVLNIFKITDPFVPTDLRPEQLFATLMRFQIREDDRGNVALSKNVLVGMGLSESDAGRIAVDFVRATSEAAYPVDQLIGFDALTQTLNTSYVNLKTFFPGSIGSERLSQIAHQVMILIYASTPIGRLTTASINIDPKDVIKILKWVSRTASFSASSFTKFN
jgi:hypothetical protein